MNSICDIKRKKERNMELQKKERKKKWNYRKKEKKWNYKIAPQWQRARSRGESALAEHTDYTYQAW